MLIVGSFFTSLVIGYAIYLFKWLKKYRQYRLALKRLVKTPVDINQLRSLFEHEPIGKKIFVIVKGIMKAKPSHEDKNIFSALVETPLTQKNDPMREQLFHKVIQYSILGLLIITQVSYRDILNKAFWTRPQQIKNVDFNLQDMWGKTFNAGKAVNVSFCPMTDLTGALTETKTFEVQLEQTTNKLLVFLQSIYDFFSNLFPFSLFRGRRVIGQKISHYGLLDGNFSFVVGTAVKKGNDEISIQNTEYVTKQIGFVIRRLTANFQKQKYSFFLYTALLGIVLVYFLRWALKKYRERRIGIFESSESEPEDVPAGHQCIICYCKSRQVIFRPCKHYGLCYSCYQRLDKKLCPVCKNQVTGIIRVIVNPE